MYDRGNKLLRRTRSVNGETRIEGKFNVTQIVTDVKSWTSLASRDWFSRDIGTGQTTADEAITIVGGECKYDLKDVLLTCGGHTLRPSASPTDVRTSSISGRANRQVAASWCPTLDNY